MEKIKFSDIELSPLRTMDDFLLESARFQIPNIKELDKWARRVCYNLLYYQTNYMLMSIMIFLVISLFHPLKMLCGFISMGVAFSVFFYVTNAKPSATKFKQDHPVLSLVLIFCGTSFIVYMIGSVVVFLFGIMLPIAAIFVHASLRLRNLRNKITNKLDQLFLRKSIMGYVLQSFSIEMDML